MDYELRDLRVWFPVRRGLFNRVVGHIRAVDGVSLHIREGETLGLVGESGCGKTTLGRAMVGLEKPCSGTLRFAGEDVSSLKGRALRAFRRNCQMVFQDPFSSLNPRMTVQDILTEAMVCHGIIGSGERKPAAVQLLNEVGLGADALNRYPHEFSGGQRQRISIARALSLKPSFLICDEPVSALDVSVQAQVINLLLDLREKRGLTYLFISHDLSVVRMIAQRVAVMYLGRVVELGPVEQVMEQPRHPYTRALLSAVPRTRQGQARRILLKGEQPSPANPPGGCPFHPRCPMAEEDCAQFCPQLTGEGSHQWACGKVEQ